MRPTGRRGYALRSSSFRLIRRRWYAPGDHEPVKYDAFYLQEHFEALEPFGYEYACGGSGDIVLNVSIALRARRSFELSLPPARGQADCAAPVDEAPAESWRSCADTFCT